MEKKLWNMHSSYLYSWSDLEEAEESFGKLKYDLFKTPGFCLMFSLKNLNEILN